MVQKRNITILVNVSLAGGWDGFTRSRDTRTAHPSARAPQRREDRRPTAVRGWSTESHLRGGIGGIAFARILIARALFVWMSIVVRQPRTCLVSRSAHWNFLKTNAKHLRWTSLSGRYFKLRHHIGFWSIIVWEKLQLRHRLVGAPSRQQNPAFFKPAKLLFTALNYAVHNFGPVLY